MNESSTKSSKKYSFLPLLIVLFLISYGIMTMLIVEQGNTIESQRLLIKQLFSDSAQLSAMKGQQAQQHYKGKAHPKAFAHSQPPQARPQQVQPRVDLPQPVANPQRSTVSL